MDLKKIQGLDSLMPMPTTGAKSPAGNVGGPSFRDTLDSLGSLQGPAKQSAASVAAKDGIKFSNHAIDRMRTRGITFSPEDISRLSEAVGKAAAKGSKDSLILMNDSALIVSVKNNTVVTVMDKNALKENVFTNIDSTIVM
ncbi:TIGR02530 family flagellar biosynthesis protein [Bdellovibrio sp. HCB337]|uniref:TIGR02530 family flagellar biosynthesis protein n=1 Tax=Bdellovibrio sp. HCB337 TaxID=3394358 RepID=UPI0039A6AEEC